MDIFRIKIYLFINIRVHVSLTKLVNIILYHSYFFNFDLQYVHKGREREIDTIITNSKLFQNSRTKYLHRFAIIYL